MGIRGRFQRFSVDAVPFAPVLLPFAVCPPEAARGSASKIPVAEGDPPKAGEPTGLVPRGSGERHHEERFFQIKRLPLDKRDEAILVQDVTRRHRWEEEIRQAKERHGLSYGDTYMATALARLSKRPVGSVAEGFSQNRGRGWGAMALSMGIKPGSPEFHQMKANARGSVGHMKTMAKAEKRQKQQEMRIERENDRKIRAKTQGEGQGKGKKK